jgi:hypothetical protein
MKQTSEQSTQCRSSRKIQRGSRVSPALPDEAWLCLLESDPRPWLLQSEEPAARWVTLSHLLDREEDDPELRAAHRAVFEHLGTKELIGRLPNWEKNVGASGHSSPAFAPNLLLLLADLGVRGGDVPRIERLLDSMLEHQSEADRFQSFGTHPRVPKPFWGALLCDTHAITEALVRFGRADNSHTRAAIKRMAADLTDTPQGLAWPCLPDPISGFRGPGRKADVCPQVTLEALRCFARLPEHQRPETLLEVARTALGVWRARTKENPYMFGHGISFKTVKWPALWYDVHWVLDTLGRYPALWRGKRADPADRRALAELAACLIAYNFGSNGTVTPKSCYRGFEGFSFGQKKHPSPFATARLAAVLRRFDDLSDEIRAVDVSLLAGSKGGTGHVVPPRAYRGEYQLARREHDRET